MKKFRPVWLAVAAAAFLVACGGGGEGDQSHRNTYGKMVTFGDSLSDVGSYNVGVVTALTAGAGGRYTINGTPDSGNWTDFLAAELNLDALCPAQTGLNTDAMAFDGPGGVPDFGPVAEVNHAGCYSYAQGGARVTNPVGPGNIMLWLGFADPSGLLGQLTKPIVEQISRHLATTTDGKFAADDLVTVMAGGNDLFMQVAAFESMVGAGMSSDEAGAVVVEAMALAGTELAGYVKNQIVANGAQRVVVVNLPDASGAPAFIPTGEDDIRPLALSMIQAFNAALAQNLVGSEAQVLHVDAFTGSHDQLVNPSQYGLTNVTIPACDLANMTLPTSLTCTPATLTPGVDAATSQFADGVHPTPYGYKLLAQLVTGELAKKGWL